ncbi:unnamed protein product [Trichobilharzia szidati]|nr:unnamed protein product [Trichobilharzia szidati]
MLMFSPDGLNSQACLMSSDGNVCPTNLWAIFYMQGKIKQYNEEYLEFLRITVSRSTYAYTTLIIITDKRQLFDSSVSNQFC